MKASVLCVALALGFGWTPRARADAGSSEPAAPVCIQAADAGQASREAGKLVSARASFITCAASSCPAVVKKQCGEWLAEVDRQVPTASFVAKDASGQEVVDVEVSIDDRPVAAKLDGRAVQLDPGRHVVRFRRAGTNDSTESTLVFRSGEKDRVVELRFAAPRPPAVPAPAAPPSSSVDEGPKTSENKGLQVPLIAWAGLGAAVLGTGTLVTFATLANDQEGALRRTCAPSCPASDSDSLHRKIVFGNIGLGVAIVGLGTTLVSTILANRRSSAPNVAVEPVRGGAAASVGGTF